MNNGRGNGDTETGAYTSWAAPGSEQRQQRDAMRCADRSRATPSGIAAYYDPSRRAISPTRRDRACRRHCAAPAGSQRRELQLDARARPDARGQLSELAGPYGTFDQGGNVSEWNERIVVQSFGTLRAHRGGHFVSSPSDLRAAFYDFDFPSDVDYAIGFRLVMLAVPEPSTGLLVLAGLLGLVSWRKARASDD
jgi:hypothetical protein